MTITYEYKNHLYLNITNRCQNRCVFCIREGAKGIGGYDLWLEEEPSAEEVIEAIGDAGTYDEIVFCGFGEPLTRIEVVKEVCRRLKDTYAVPIRINTNGLANLVHGRNILPELAGLVDIISISLNAASSEEYQRISRPKIGEDSYQEVLNFITEAKEHIPRVITSVVDYPGVDVEGARRKSEELGVEFRIRSYQRKLEDSK